MPEEITISSSIGEVSAEYQPGKQIAIFSHGFGVKRDSRGMFTDITQGLPADFGYILFDYNYIDGSHVHLRGYNEQTEMLRAVLDFAVKKTESVHVIGHSMGAITVSLLGDMRFQNVVLLAPPVSTSRSRKYFNEYPGAYRDHNNILAIPRKDGTTTHVPDSFFDDAEKVDPIAVMSAYAQKHPVVIVQAKDEDVLSHTENYDHLATADGVELIRINGNHNFDPPHRLELVAAINQLLI